MKCLKTIIIKQNKHGQAFISSKFLRPIWSSLFPENNKIKKVLVFSNTYPWFSCIVLGLVFTHIGSQRAILAGSAFSVSTLPTYVSLQKEKNWRYRQIYHRLHHCFYNDLTLILSLIYDSEWTRTKLKNCTKYRSGKCHFQKLKRINIVKIQIQ